MAESVYITAFFANAGTPATGLTPTIRIRRLDTQALVVTDAAMTEVGDGGYLYDFTGAFLPALDYSIRADGGAGLPALDRYQFGALDSLGSDVHKIRKVTTNRVVVDPTDTTITVYEDDDATTAFTFSLSGDRRDRTPT